MRKARSRLARVRPTRHPWYDRAMTDTLLVEDRAGVRTVTWNRPDALNAMSLELWDGTRDALRSAVTDGMACVVLTGTGRAFNVGQDLSEMTDPRHADEKRGFRGLMRAITEVEVPLIAAVNGLAVGFGVTVLPWCELVLASTQARFRAPFVGLGVTTEAGSSVTLPTVMGRQAAAHFVLTGEWLGAAEAQQSGLVWRLAEPDELLTEAHSVAARIAAQPPNALRTTTRLMRAGRTEAWLDAIERENAAFAELAGGPENLAAIETFFSR
jgi:enoyl-CoA hydratase/carnithine racemase